MAHSTVLGLPVLGVGTEVEAFEIPADTATELDRDRVVPVFLQITAHGDGEKLCERIVVVGRAGHDLVILIKDGDVIGYVQLFGVEDDVVGTIAHCEERPHAAVEVEVCCVIAVDVGSETQIVVVGFQGGWQP